MCREREQSESRYGVFTAIVCCGEREGASGRAYAFIKRLELN